MLVRILLTVVLSTTYVVSATIPVGTEPVDVLSKDYINCVNPSDNQLVRILSESDAFLIHLSDDTDLNSENDSKPEYAEDAQAMSKGKLHCPVGESISESSPIRLRSVCPWELLDDFDSNRFPKTIQKATCRCSNCIDPKTNQLNENSSCVPVYYPMPVLRRTGCKDGVATFEPRYEQVPVACDCRVQKIKKVAH